MRRSAIDRTGCRRRRWRPGREHDAWCRGDPGSAGRDLVIAPEHRANSKADAVRPAIAGSSGPFYAAALLRAAQILPETPTARDWSVALSASVGAIAEL